MAKVIVNGSTHFEIENGTIDGNAVSAEIIKTGERFFMFWIMENPILLKWFVLMRLQKQ